MISLLSILHPGCPGCDSEKYPSVDGSLCPECRSKLKFFDPAIRCPGCGGENRSSADLCPQCMKEPPRPWQQALSVFAYQTAGKELIRRFKFANSPELARPLGILAAEVLEDAGISADMIVPVPLSILRYCTRSYNQAALLAQIISSQTGIPFCNALHRKISFRHQASLDRKARHKGLQNIFSVRRRAGITGKSILLVDDVFTTGATLAAAAGKLLAAGAASISVLTIARPLWSVKSK
ncbi:MAG: ComF family protein [Lentisphaerae bacterium]|nr:ComF family protein [Lentisphaerota bacterium]